MKSRKKNKADFGYKISPFQKSKAVIVNGTFLLKKGDPRQIREKMEGFRKDRENKGHFWFPCAGSIFKNSRNFGLSSGKIIDSLGLKGTAVGSAKVSDYHGNIIINTGNATAKDVLRLIQIVENKVKDRYNLALEREILFVGRTSQAP